MTLSSPNVLLVGAGGIGCELLKNLVLNGYKNISLVDLDTIDVSNLNRQFLFHKKHVGKSKAEVARDSVSRFRKDVNICAFHQSIFSRTFDLEFFQRFDIVFNALDNQAARRHVNRMCLATKRPLIESGTAGYLGQVEPLLPTGLVSSESVSLNGDSRKYNASEHAGTDTLFKTACYECQPRGGGQRTYPACTIRNTPSEPVHCVVWAKYLFNQLFGEPDVDDEDVSPDSTDPELKQPAENVNPGFSGDVSENESTTISTANSEEDVQTRNNHTVDNVKVSLRDWFTSQWKKSKSSNELGDPTKCSVSTATQALAWRLFHDDLKTLVSMRDLWMNRLDRREPSPMDQSTMDQSLIEDAGQSSGSSELRDQRCLMTSGWLRMFMDSTDALQRRILASSESEPLSWDKDDTLAMDFVAGASVLRAQLFHLMGADQLNRFTIKSLAGNIVPAIATTNAIIAGLMVLQARNVLLGDTKHIRTVYLHRKPTGRRGQTRLVVPCEPAPPNPSCITCGIEAVGGAKFGLVCNLDQLTLRTLRDRILIRQLGMLAPDVELSDRGVILISSEEGETDEDTLDKPLCTFGVLDGSCLQCDDFQQDFALKLTVSGLTKELAEVLANSAESSLEQSSSGLYEGWHLVGDVTQVMLAAKGENPQDAPLRNGSGASNDINAEDIVKLDSAQSSLSGRSTKRNEEASNHVSTSIDDLSADAPANKRMRFESDDISHNDSGDGQHVIADNDDSDNDLIMLD